MEIVSKSTKFSGEVVVNVDMPDTLDGLVAKFGEEAVRDAAIDAFVISIQSLVRNRKKKGQIDEEIQEAADGWRPGVRAERSGVSVTAMARTLKTILALPKEEVEAYIQETRIKLAEAQAKADAAKAAKGNTMNGGCVALEL